MFASGHLALGYITGKASSKILKSNINVPLIFALSILPDIDLLIRHLTHRSLTHSIITIGLISLPFLMAYGKKIAPYFLAIVQHSLVGDFLTGGIQPFWPVTQEWYGIDISLRSSTNITIEWASFLISFALMLMTGDLKELLKARLSNLFLVIPMPTSILSLVLFNIPLQLLIPHIIYLVIFSTSILFNIKKYLIQTP